MADAIDTLLDSPAPGGGAAPGGQPPVMDKLAGIHVRPWSQRDQAQGIPNPDPQAAGPGTPAPNDQPVQDPSSPLEAGLGGIAKAGFEMKDTAVSLLGGEHTPPSEMRKGIETRTQTLDEQSPVNSLATGIAQFGTAFIGLGKVLKPLAFGTQLLKPGMAADTLLGGVTGSVAFDPHEHALDSLVQQFPALQGPIAQYLAAKPDESDAEGRLRNGIENIVVGGAIAGGVSGAAKASSRLLTSLVEAIKLRRLGNTAGANAAVADAEGALKRAQRPDNNAGAPASDGGRIGNDGTPATPLPANSLQGEQPPGGAAGLDAAGGSAGGEVLPGQPGELNAGGQGGSAGQPAGPTLERVPPGEPVRPIAPVKPPEVTPEQVRGLINKAQKDTGAILDAGSYDAAAQEGHAFAETDLIPWQKFSTGEERVDAWMARVVDEQADYINKARGGEDGVMSDRQVNMLVGRLGYVYGQDPALLRGMILQAGKDAKTMVAKMETAFVLSQKGFQDAYGMAMRINAGNTQGLQLEQAVGLAKERIASAVEMFAAGKAMVAAGGRMVRRMQGQFSSVDMAQLDAMKANLGKMGTQDFLDLVSSTQGNPAALADQVLPSAWSQVVSYSTMVAAASKVWGWSTAVAIAFGNVSQVYLRPVAAALGAHYQLGQAAMKGDDALMASAAATRQQALKELMVTTSLLNDGWQGAKFAFIKGQSRLGPHSFNQPVNSELQAGGTSNTRMGMGNLGMGGDFRPITSVDDIIFNTMEAGRVLAGDPAEALATSVSLPFRLHGAIQEATQTMRYRAVVMAKATQEAREMGLEPPVGAFGWNTKEGRAYLAHIEGRVRDSFDVNGQALDLQALQEARDSTFGSKLLGSGTNDTWGEMTSTGAALQHFAADYQYVRFIAPFIQFPANAFRRGIQLTPGLNLLQKQYLNDITGVNGAMPQARATGEMGLGLMLGMKAVQLRLDGRMAGGSAESPKEAQSRRQEGMTPYSLVYHNGEGKEQYFQLNRLEPYQAPLTFWADMTELLMAGHAAEWKMPTTPEAQAVDPIYRAFTASMLATMHILKDKTSLTNISQLMDALEDEHKMETFFSRTVPGMLPFGSLSREANSDPFLREIRGGAISGLIDGVKAQIPGLSTTLPPRRDFLGKPVSVPGRFLNDGVLSPTLKDALEENYVATGHYPTVPSPKTPEGLDLRDVQMQGGQMAYERYKQLLNEPKVGGPNLQASLEHLVGTDTYKALTHGKTSEEGTKENAIEHLLTSYHQGALGTLKGETTQDGPKLGMMLNQRKVDIMHQNMTNQRDLRAVKGAGQVDAINRILDGSGAGFRLPPVNTNIPPQQ